MSARPKAEIVAERTAERKAAGLVKAVVWIHPRDRERLGRYVRERLAGEYTPRRDR